MDCGFLACDDSEAGRGNRQILEQGTALADVPEARYQIEEHLRCFKSLWPRGTRGATEIVREINKERASCEGFFPYTPGYSPAEHRSLMEKKQDHRREIIIGAISLAAGSLLTLLTGRLRKRLGF